MAAAASSSSPPDRHDSSSSYSGKWEYDVFLCFRGSDTRRGFASHLMAALADKQIKAFIDTMLRKTESIDELLSVLQRSPLSIVIFSENFADSPWCLDEVATIVQSMAKFKHRALPVFYKVRWSDVAGDSGRYSAIINDELKACPEENKRWRDALKAVANCAGHTSTAIPMESELVKLIVEDVQKILIDMSPSIKSSNLVGMGSRVWEVEKLLAMEEVDDTFVIGLWGMGGTGKTTLAKACYERIVSSAKDFKNHFVQNINGNCEKQYGVAGVVHNLYSKLLSENGLSSEDLDLSYRRARLSRLKVFIVLDDVDTPCQLEELFLGDVFNSTKLFAAGSRIIVTTRNKKVLQTAMAKIYAIGCLSDDESIELFSLRAFNEDCPPDNWMDLSRLATLYCKGNPLALRVLGGTLFGEDRHYWESLLSGLRLIENPEIHDVLRRSYDKLGADEKQIFLDVACFLHEISRSRLIGYMTSLCPSAHAKVKNLIDKSLLISCSCEDVEKIEVHDLLKEMAWNIVNDEPKLRKRSRLVNPEDIHKLLTTTKVKNWTTFLMKPFFKGIEMVVPSRKRKKVADMHRKGISALVGDRTTRGISLDLSKANEMQLETNAFEGMDSLTFLKFCRSEEPLFKYPILKKIHFPNGILDSLPDGLRLLHWDEYPSKSLPSRFYPQHIVHLIIRDSPIKICWEGFDQPMLVNLVVLDLSYCFNLSAIPDLSRSLKLEELLLTSCKSLVELPSYVQHMDKLMILDLGYCINLEHLPSKLNSKFLVHFRMYNCPKVRSCPKINSRNLVDLDLDGTPVRELPSAIYNVKQHGTLRLCGENITNFPSISVRLQQFYLSHTAIEELNLSDQHQASSELLPTFTNLDLVGNSLLKSLPKSIWNMVSFYLVITHSPLLESLPEISAPVDGLYHLSISMCESLKSLPSSINNLVSLGSLRLRNTGIKSLPSCIQELDRLRSIDLCNCKSLESIPDNIHKLPALECLYLTGCRSILSLPELPLNLNVLDIGGCTSLQVLPSNARKLSFNALRFYDCPQLDRTLPDEIMAYYQIYARFSRFSKGELQYSGNEIPEWFAYKNMSDKDDSCVTVQLPPANGSSKQVNEGIVFGMVWSSDASKVSPVMKCDCNFGAITIASWSSYPLPLDTWNGMNSSDQVFLWFDKSTLGKTKERKGRGDAWYVEYAGHTVSFRFYPYLHDQKDVKFLKNFKIKRCGVSLLY